jgi:hypothetical protein
MKIFLVLFFSCLAYSQDSIPISDIKISAGYITDFTGYVYQVDNGNNAQTPDGEPYKITVDPLNATRRGIFTEISTLQYFAQVMYFGNLLRQHRYSDFSLAVVGSMANSGVLANSFSMYFSHDYGHAVYRTSHADTFSVYATRVGYLGKPFAGFGGWRPAFEVQRVKSLNIARVGYRDSSEAALKVTQAPFVSNKPLFGALMGLVKTTTETGSIYADYGGRFLFGFGQNAFAGYEDSVQAVGYKLRSVGPDWYIDAAGSLVIGFNKSLGYIILSGEAKGSASILLSIPMLVLDADENARGEYYVETAGTEVLYRGSLTLKVTF